MSTLYIDRKGLGCKLENGALVFYENGERCGTVPTAPLERIVFKSDVSINISGPPTLVKQDVKYFPPQAVRERESALAVAAGRTNLSELARVNSGNEARPGTR